MKKNKKSFIVDKESGNVLFLILIAVALFAALSYAVTSSTRSAGDANEETNLISSAQLTQYPASIRTSIVRMIINGASVDELAFNLPPFDDLDPGNYEVGVFHPQGGGAVYSPAPTEVMLDGKQGQWFFNGKMQIPLIGTDGVGGNDIIAFLPGIKKSVCRKINEELGIGSVTPILSQDHTSAYEANMIDDDQAFDTPPTNFDDLGEGAVIDDDETGDNVFDGQPFGCFQNKASSPNNKYVYYHVLVER